MVSASADASRGVVMAALVANAAIAALKYGAYLLTDSASMLSETYHSLSDVGNQVLLLVGLFFAGRTASRRHPFGWGKAEYFYAFVVAVLLFGIAGWESLREGWHGVQAALAGHGHLPATGSADVLGATVPTLWISFAVLAGAFAFEAYALNKALKGMRATMERDRHPSLWATFKGTKNAAVLTAFTEDLLALGGLVVAAAALALAHLTGQAIFDALGAVVIGLMLMGFAVLLAWEHKRLIVGEAMEPWQEDEIEDIALAEAGVHAVRDLRSVHFGTSYVVVALDVAFAADLEAEDLEAAVDRIEAGIRERFPWVRRIYVEAEGAPVRDPDGGDRGS